MSMYITGSSSMKWRLRPMSLPIPNILSGCCGEMDDAQSSSKFCKNYENIFSRNSKSEKFGPNGLSANI